MGWRARPVRAVVVLLAVSAVCLGAGAALGAAAAGALASTYTAHATVLVTPLEGNPFNPTGNGDDLENLQSEAQLAQSDAVANLVASSALDPAGDLTVEVPPNTQLLEFSYQAAGGASAARDGVQELASAYLKFRTSRADQAVVAQARAIQDEIDVQTKRINELARQKGGVRSAEQRAVIQQQMDGMASQIVQLSTTLSAVTTVDRDPGQIVTKGHVVGRSPQTNRVIYGTGGALVVWAAGIAGLVLLGRRRAQAADATDLPTLTPRPIARERDRDGDRTDADDEPGVRRSPFRRRGAE